MPANENNDDKLIEMLLGDQPEALDHLFLKYYSALYRTVTKIVCDKDVAKDIIQELFYNLWLKRHCLNFKKPFNAYLFRSAINRSSKIEGFSKVSNNKITRKT